MQTHNKISIIGNLGKDPELTHVGDKGTAVCKFPVATTDNVKRGGEWVEETEWHNVETWGSTAEACAKYLRKGSQVFVEGRLKTNVWEDNDGNKRYHVFINTKEIQFLSRIEKGEGGSSGGKSSGGSKSAPKEEPDDYTFEPDDELPF